MDINARKLICTTFWPHLTQAHKVAQSNFKWIKMLKDLFHDFDPIWRKWYKCKTICTTILTPFDTGTSSLDRQTQMDKYAIKSVPPFWTQDTQMDKNARTFVVPAFWPHLTQGTRSLHSQNDGGDGLSLFIKSESDHHVSVSGNPTLKITKLISMLKICINRYLTQPFNLCYVWGIRCFQQRHIFLNNLGQDVAVPSSDRCGPVLTTHASLVKGTGEF